MPPERAGEWMTGSRALGLPSGITRNLTNTTTHTINTYRGHAAAILSAHNRTGPLTKQLKQ